MTDPINFSGKLSCKIIIKDDYVRNDGTCALYVQIFLDGTRKRLPLNIAVKACDFIKKTQRIKNNKDYNIIIEKALSDIHQIELAFRLKDKHLTMEMLLKEYYNPSPKIDFIKFYEHELLEQKKILKETSFRQQRAVLNKLKEYKPSILFHELDEKFIKQYIHYLTHVRKEQKLTVTSSMKNIKKYLHLAAKQGIVGELKYTDIKVPAYKSSRTFLDEQELQLMKRYYRNEFISDVHKDVLSRFLFSCYTGLRISDNLKLSTKNIISGVLSFSASKTGKFQRFDLPIASLEYINMDNPLLFNGTYSEQYINRVLKDIANHLRIVKTITFHVSRHTFATRFLRKGGSVVVLQEALGHTNINDTMIYVHITGQDLNNQMNFLD